MAASRDGVRVIQAGKMDQRLVIQTAGVSKGTSGEDLETWTSWKTVWGSVEPLTAREWFGSRQANAAADFRFRIRYLASVDTKTKRISWDSRIFLLASALPDGPKKRELVMLATEVL